MHPTFFALPKSRQMQIVNAAMEVFSQRDYRHCVTDDIAARAGISKGFLFHYFENKLGLYLYQYALNLVSERLRAPAIAQERDFFKLLERAALEKLAPMKEHPSLFAFFFQSRLERDETVLQALGGVWDPLIVQSAGRILAQTDWNRFRDDVEPKLVLDLVLSGPRRPAGGGLFAAGPLSHALAAEAPPLRRRAAGGGGHRLLPGGSRQKAGFGGPRRHGVGDLYRLSGDQRRSPGAAAGKHAAAGRAPLCGRSPPPQRGADCGDPPRRGDGGPRRRHPGQRGGHPHPLRGGGAPFRPPLARGRQLISRRL
ncbi:TetR/AcrR family transcriptional regulator [Bittarella massiliensis]|nr:TetR/AcrR family transcriptional regulator [Bittarella massiliensis (ex Durand et al. 2017)]